MISIVAIFLIFCIFYMIVVEKTKDIGIIKCVGADEHRRRGDLPRLRRWRSASSGAWLGLLLGYLIVHVHQRDPHVDRARRDVGSRHIWNPEVYAFDTIPNTMNPHEVFWIVVRRDRRRRCSGRWCRRSARRG